MPTYDYECASCGHSFEAFQSMSEEPIRSCPECGKQVRRLVGGGSGVIFKGAGFYKNDSRAKPAAKCDSCPKSEGSSCAKEAV
jgi:putative FmdB family regulatory protein